MEVVEKEPPEHGKWLGILEREFYEEGFTTIREGKMFLEGEHWKAPDLFVLKDNRLVFVLEVIVTEGYREILKKAKRIKQLSNPKHIAVFEPVSYMDKNFLPEKKEHYKRYYLGRYPNSYKEIEDFVSKKWKDEKNIEVLFWNENTYYSNIKKLSAEDS